MALSVRLIGWNQEEADVHAATIRSWGYQVSAQVPIGGTPLLRELRPNPPHAIVIDLDRLPSHGKAMAAFLRSSKPLRSVPLVLASGAPDKIAAIRQVLPDAIYTGWEGLRDALAHAKPVDAPVAVPLTIRTDAPLSRKLNIKPGMRVLVPNAPATFFRTVGDLPEGAEWVESHPYDLEIYFASDSSELEQRFARAVPHPLWIAWPKAASGRSSGDLKQQTIREWGMSVGLVDYKICSLDRNWSAILFTRRKATSRKQQP